MGTVPSSRRSPGASGTAPAAGRPLTRTPFVEPRSAHGPARAGRADLRVAAGDVRVGEDDVALARAADDGARRRGRAGACPPRGRRRGRGARGAPRRWAPGRGPRSEWTIVRPCCACSTTPASAAGRTRRAWMPNSPRPRRSSVVPVDLGRETARTSRGARARAGGPRARRRPRPPCRVAGAVLGESQMTYSLGT
jgi:hypothetical protein